MGFGAWSTPEGGFNWDMLANVGAGMLANSQYDPMTAMGKGYAQASQNSLEQAKTGLMFQDYDRKQREEKAKQEFRDKYLPQLMSIGSGGGQPPPQAGANLGMPTQAGAMPMGGGGGGGALPPMPSAGGAPPPQQMAQAAPPPAVPPPAAPQAMPQFDSVTYNKLINFGMAAKANGDDDGASAALMKANAMKTLYDQQMAQGDLANKQAGLGLQREQFQAGEVHKGRDENLNERKFFDETQGKPAREQIKTLTEQEYTARSSNAKMGLMRQYAGDQGFYSGRLGENVVLPFKQALRSLGVAGAEGVDSMEAFNSLAKQGVMDLAGGSLGRQISDADVKAMNAQVANLNNTIPGNNRIMDILEKVNDRKIEYSKQARAYYKEHKSLEGFDDQFSAYADAHPMFAGMKEPKPSTTPTDDGIPTYYLGKGWR